MIVPVTAARAPAWAALCAALWPGNAIDDLLAEYADGLHPHEFLYCPDAPADAAPVAFLSLSLRKDYVEGASGNPVGYLEGIYVAPDHRRQGIARALVAFARAWTRDQGATQLASDCALKNAESRAFHRAAGFAETNIVVCFLMDAD